MTYSPKAVAELLALGQAKGGGGMSRSGLRRELTKAAKLNAAINNEYLTRERVEKLENKLAQLEQSFGDVVRRYDGMSSRRRSRLRWLLTGRFY